MTDNEILEQVKTDFIEGYDAEKGNKDRWVEDVSFAYNVGTDGQWPSSLRTERDTEGDFVRPVHVMNKLRKFVHQIISDQRQNKPKIKVHPEDLNADTDTAETYEGLIRDIEYESHADMVYDTAYEHAVTGGFGYIRLLTEYENDMSFYQTARIKRIRNPLAVTLDPNAQEFLKTDGKYGFISHWYRKKDFEKEYPGADTRDFASSQTGERRELWFTTDKVRVAEYFRKVPDNKVIVLLDTGQVIELTDDITLEYLYAMGFKVIDKRTVKKDKIVWSKITGNEVLERQDWIGSFIPIIPVYGDEVVWEGETFYLSFIRDAKDPQRVYNFWFTSMTEIIANATKAEYLAEADTISKYKDMWNSNKTRRYLLYDSMGKGIAPVKQKQTDIPQGANLLLNLGDFNIRDTLGYYKAAIGQESNERSGKAILERKRESEGGTFSYADNLIRAITYLGEQIVDLFQSPLFNMNRTLRIRNEEGKIDFVTVNLGEHRLGRYGVVVDAGASFATKRLEDANLMATFVQYAPQILPVTGDLIAKGMGLPTEFVERLEKLVPPQLKGGNGSMPQENIAPAGAEPTGAIAPQG